MSEKGEMDVSLQSRKKDKTSTYTEEFAPEQQMSKEGRDESSSNSVQVNKVDMSK